MARSSFSLARVLCQPEGAQDPRDKSRRDGPQIGHPSSIPITEGIYQVGGLALSGSAPRGVAMHGDYYGEAGRLRNNNSWCICLGDAGFRKKDYGACMKKLLSIFATLSLCLIVGHTASAATTTFVTGLSTPTGIAVHPSVRELYVNSGASGKVWSVEILPDGSAGTVSTLTEGFVPDLDVVFDAEGNLYGTEAGMGYLYRLGSDGQVSIAVITWLRYNFYYT
jgi:DNA-binding beta-propeller fold protein YncE